MLIFYIQTQLMKSLVNIYIDVSVFQYRAAVIETVCIGTGCVW